jgi:5-methylcytosine-specific restriction endonuclease McrA
MEKILKDCLNCSKKFETETRYITRGQGKFCSQSCSSSYAAKRKSEARKDNCICSYCSKTFYKAPSKIKNKSNTHYCCREHKDKAQRLGGVKEIQPNHYGTGSGAHSYRIKAFRILENQCNRCGWKQYKSILVVHHKDRNRRNNSIDNLEILCPNCHSIEHYLR